MSPADVVTAIFVLISLFFFVAGTVGLLRFPDVFTRLHALTKADNVGLGMLVIGLAITAGSLREVFVLLFVWGLVLLASTTSAHLIARTALARGIEPWEEP